MTNNVELKMSSKDFDEAIKSRCKSLADYNKQSENLIYACIDGYNNSILNGGTVGNKTRFIQFLSPHATNGAEAYAIMRYLQETTNIKSMAFNVKTNKLELVIPTPEENKMRVINEPTMGYVAWLAVEASKKPKIEITEDTLAARLAKIIKTANKENFDFDKILNLAKSKINVG